MSEAIPDDVRQAVAARRAPAQLTEKGLLERFGDPDDVEVEPHQVWRARWDGTAAVVLVLTADQEQVVAAPVTVDPPGEDDLTVVVGSELTAFAVQVSAWAGLSRPLPLRVLDRLLDVWPSGVAKACLRLLKDEDLQQADGLRQGVAPDSPFHLHVAVRAEVDADMAELAAAPGLPVADPADPTPNPQKLGLAISTVKRVLGVGQPEAMAFLRGAVPLTSEQAAALADEAGVTPDDVLATVHRLPAALAREAEHPRLRPRIAAVAAKRGDDERTARTAAAYQVYGTAARQTGGGPESDWRQRLRLYLDAELAEGQSP